MNRKYIPGVLMLVGLIMTMSGCQQPESCLAAKGFEEEGKLIEAVDNYEQCLQELTSKGGRKKSQEAIKALKTQITDATISEVRSQIGAGEMVGQCDYAISALEAKSNYDDHQNRIAALIEEYRYQRQELMTKVEQYLEMASEQAHNRQWKNALLNIDSALVINPNHYDAKAMIQKIIHDRNGYYKQAIEKLCGEEDWERALSVLESFAAEEPKPQDDILQSMYDTKETVVRNCARRLIEQKKYFTAHTTIQKAKVSKCEDILDVIRQEGSSYYVDIAREEKKKVKDFNAYIAAVKARILEPDSDEIFVLHRDYADFVDNSVQLRIGIAEFKAPTKEPDAGREFSDALISYLSKVLPYGIKIDEREKMDFTVQKQGLHEAVKLLGLNLAIFGNVSTFSVEEQNSEREIPIWVKISKTVVNPRYEQDIQELQSSFGYDRTRWPYTPEPTFTREVSDKVTYKAGNGKIEGVMVVSPRIFSTVKGAVIGSETFTVTKEVNDQFQEGVPEANIPDDPLELPTSLKFKQELRQEMVKKVAEWVMSNFDQRHRRYYQEAQYFIERREFDNAVRALAQSYLCCLRGNVPDEDESAAQIRQLVLYDLTEGSE